MTSPRVSCCRGEMKAVHTVPCLFVSAISAAESTG